MTAYLRWLGSTLLGIVTVTGAASCSLESGIAESDTLFDQDTDQDLSYWSATLSDDLPRNGLASAAISRASLTAPVTQLVMNAIKNGALTAPIVLSDDDRAWLGGSDALASNARELMKYIVSCALDPGVQGLPNLNDISQDWRGELGLCDGQPGTLGSWADGPPSEGCLQAVSACVLARVNALSKRVIISMRGESTELLPVRPRVKVETKYRENHGTPIRSFEVCRGSPAPAPTQDCGWEARYVGMCSPNRLVTLQVNGSARIRICKGIYGCDHADIPQTSTGTEYYTPWYAGHIVSTPASSTLTFTCPQAPVPAKTRSYFSVMLASPSSTSSLDPRVDVTVTGPSTGQYPAPENMVFTYREGAFYGNIFAAVQPLGPSRPSPSDLLTNFQYACYSDDWSSKLAQLSDRLCAGPTNQCFENVPQPCQPRCLIQAPGTGAYLQCNEAVPESRQWDHAITVYLNHPCDLASDINDCKERLNLAVQ